MPRLLPLVIWAVLARACLAQLPARSEPQPVVEGKREFEVASVRENKSGGPATSNLPLDRGDAYSSTGGVFTATNQSVVALLIFAYRINVSEFRGGLMRRLPGWATSARFDINARSESKQPGREEMRLMMQSLLEDCFKLKVHREQERMPVYGLYFLKPGHPAPQLRPHDPSASCSTPLPRAPAETSAADLVGRWPETCGDGKEARRSRDLLREGGRDMTMAAIASWLTGAGESDRPFVDRTEAPGAYDFILEFDPESLGREPISSVPRDDAGPTFQEAVKEQLGLEARKEAGLIRIFVVDDIEYPTPN